MGPIDDPLAEQVAVGDDDRNIVGGHHSRTTGADAVDAAACVPDFDAVTNLYRGALRAG